LITSDFNTALLRGRTSPEEKQFGQWVNLLEKNGKSCLLEKKIACLDSRVVSDALVLTLIFNRSCALRHRFRDPLQQIIVEIASKVKAKNPKVVT
jgi:hypothetical protein